MGDGLFARALEVSTSAEPAAAVVIAQQNAKHEDGLTLEVHCSQQESDNHYVGAEWVWVGSQD